MSKAFLRRSTANKISMKQKKRGNKESTDISIRCVCVTATSYLRSTDRYPGSTCSILTRVRSIKLLHFHCGACAPHIIDIFHLKTSRIEIIPYRNKDRHRWSIPSQKQRKSTLDYSILRSSPPTATCCQVMGTGAPCQSGEVEPKILLA